jgi:hypothetical protein
MQGRLAWPLRKLLKVVEPRPPPLLGPHLTPQPAPPASVRLPWPKKRDWASVFLEKVVDTAEDIYLMAKRGAEAPARYAPGRPPARPPAERWCAALAPAAPRTSPWPHSRRAARLHASAPTPSCARSWMCPGLWVICAAAPFPGTQSTAWCVRGTAA